MARPGGAPLLSNLTSNQIVLRSPLPDLENAAHPLKHNPPPKESYGLHCVAHFWTCSEFFGSANVPLIDLD